MKIKYKFKDGTEPITLSTKKLDAPIAIERDNLQVENYVHIKQKSGQYPFAILVLHTNSWMFQTDRNEFFIPQNPPITKQEDAKTLLAQLIIFSKLSQKDLISLFQNSALGTSKKPSYAAPVIDGPPIPAPAT